MLLFGQLAFGQLAFLLKWIISLPCLSWCVVRKHSTIIDIERVKRCCSTTFYNLHFGISESLQVVQWRFGMQDVFIRRLVQVGPTWMSVDKSNACESGLCHKLVRNCTHGYYSDRKAIK